MTDQPRDILKVSSNIHEVTEIVTLFLKSASSLQHTKSPMPYHQNTTTPTCAATPPGDRTLSDQSAEVLRLTQQVEVLKRRLAEERAGALQAKRKLDEVVASEEVRKLKLNTEDRDLAMEEMTLKSPSAQEVTPLSEAVGDPSGPEVTQLVHVLKGFCAEARRISLPM